MLRFKSYLIEYLTDEQRIDYSHIQMTDHARKTTDPFFGRDNDTVHGEIHNDDKSEIHRQLENHLGQDLSHQEYSSGVVKDKYGRDQKIGRLIKDNDLRNQFDKDPARRTGGATSYKTRTVRGAEVAGQTNPVPNAEHPNGHSWKDISCKNLDSGINRHVVNDEIRHGTVAHFVHDHNGQEIYRATLQPHHSTTGDVAYSVDSEYGIKHPKFTEDAHRVASELSGPPTKSILYRKHANVYNDNGREFMLHPEATKEHIEQAMASSHSGDRELAAIHKNASHTHLNNLLDDKDATVRYRAASNPNLTSDLIHKALKDHIPMVSQVALYHPNSTEEHVNAALSSKESATRAHAISHPKVTEEHITKALKDRSSLVRESAITNPKATKEHLEKALQDDLPAVRMAALTHKLVGPKHIDTALKDEYDDVKILALRHPSVTHKHLLKAVQDKSPTIALTAAMHRNASPDVLRKAFEHKHWAVRRNAINHRNVPKDMLQSAVNDTDWDVSQTAQRRLRDANS